jgi:hypothetical protein
VPHEPPWVSAHPVSGDHAMLLDFDRDLRGLSAVHAAVAESALAQPEPALRATRS